MLNSYHIIWILLLVLSAYFISNYLVRRGKIALIQHRRFWNYLLLTSFLISGLLGLLLAVIIEYALPVILYREFLWIHVESGIVMAILSTIHIIWHWRYFWRRPSLSHLNK